MDNANQPDSPVTEEVDHSTVRDPYDTRMKATHYGLTKREEMARGILQALLISQNPMTPIPIETGAKRAVEYTDALLQELGK